MAKLPGNFSAILLWEGGLVAGDFEGVLYAYDPVTLEKKNELVAFKRGSVRSVSVFDASRVIASSSLGWVALVDMEKNEIEWRVRISKHPVESLRYLADIDAIAAGDEYGDLYIVLASDPKKVLYHSDPHEDSISGLVYCGLKRVLVSSGGDGHIFALDVKEMKEAGGNECLDDEVTSMVLQGQRIYCGMQSGAVNIFDMGFYGAPANRIKGFGSDISAMCECKDGILVACCEGTVTLVNGLERGPSRDFKLGIEAICCHAGAVAHLDEDHCISVWSIDELVHEKPSAKRSTRKAKIQLPLDGEPQATTSQVSFFEGLA